MFRHKERNSGMVDPHRVHQPVVVLCCWGVVAVVLTCGPPNPATHLHSSDEHSTPAAGSLRNV
eukprot:6908464-Pyramimonas_sp.AAC.1